MNSTFTYASFWTRLLAHNIDLLFVLFPLFLLSPYVKSGPTFYLLAALLYVVYQAAFDLSSWKATPGKRILGIEVINDTGNATFMRMVARNVLKFLSLAILFGGFAMINWTEKKQGLHDLLTGTIVVLKSRES